MDLSFAAFLHEGAALYINKVFPLTYTCSWNLKSSCIGRATAENGTFVGPRCDAIKGSSSGLLLHEHPLLMCWRHFPVAGRRCSLPVFVRQCQGVMWSD